MQDSRLYTFLAKMLGKKLIGQLQENILAFPNKIQVLNAKALHIAWKE